MKTFSKKWLVVGALSMLSSGAWAADSVSFNASLTTDYRYRGVSQSGSDPAIQGGVDYSADSGLYLGVWASTIDFDPMDGNIELDLYGGFKFKAAGIDWDVGFIHYGYPGSESDDELPFTEIYFGGSYGPVFVKYYYSDDFTGVTEESAYYLTAGVDLDVGNGFTLGISVGKSDGDAFVEGYTDYKIGLSKEYAGLGFNLSYIGTDIDPEVEDDVFNSEGTLVLTVSKSF